MKLSLSKEYEDLEFALTTLDSNIEILPCAEGISFDGNENFEEIAAVFLKKYQPSKTLKDLRRIRGSLEQMPVEKEFLTLVSFYNHFKSLLTSSSLKYSKYLNDVSEKVNLNYLFFYVLNIQVGQVVEAVEAEGSDKLFVETVDFGNKLQIVSGVRPYISKEEFIGSKFLFITNIKPSKVMGIPSQGMILCGKEDDRVCLLKVSDDVPNGTRLQLEKSNIVGDYNVSTIDLKKTFFKNIFNSLKITGGFVEFENIKATINSHPYKTEINNGTIS